MEVVREITSISHDGYEQMWYPLYIENDLNCKFINCHQYEEGELLIRLIQSMFSTNNHSSNTTSDFLIDRMHSTSLNSLTQCSMEFNTEKDKYLLARVFQGSYSIEVKLVSEKTRLVLFGQNALNKLSKITGPISIPGVKSYNSRSHVFKPDNEISRRSMLEMTKRWSMILGYDEEVNYRLSAVGVWAFFESKRKQYYRGDSTQPSIVLLLSTLAQAAIRTRKFGYCPAIICSVNIEKLNQTEIISLVDLVSQICLEERLSIIITTHLPMRIDSKYIVNTSTM